MYNIPISIYQETQEKILNELREKIESEIMLTIQTKCAIDVNKEELLKALQYDREQYEKGYQDGKMDAQKTGKWITLSRTSICSNCNYSLGRYEPENNYCPNCGAKMGSEEGR